MYKMTCDGLPLLDARDEALILTAPKVKLADNTVGSCSFKIYKNHPYYDRLAMLKSLFEVSDEFGVIFRGRMTENTRDIKKGKAVDLEGAMAFFNDSIVRPYTFPDDWEDEKHSDHAGYTKAAESGNVVEYFLGWLINQHNAQVAEFQQFKLGNVTVKDANNFIERASSDYPNTWEELRSKLFESSLAGHLCIRYEADGNYIDYLADFTEVNEQGITYGENLRDFSEKTDGTSTYSAIIPRGAETTSTEETGDSYEGMYGTIIGTASVKNKLTIKDLPDGDITDDIVKSGDMLYSKKAVAAFGWRFVPASESLWDDVEKAENLQTKGVDVLEGTAAKIPSRIEVKAVDLHCTDEQIRSFRMYKKIPVRILPHDINSDFDITSLDIDLLNAQNTDLVAGKTVMTFTDMQNKVANSIKKQVTEQLSAGFRVTETLIEKTETDILLKVSETYVSNDGLTEIVDSKITVAKGEILQSVSGTYITQDDLTGYTTKEEVGSQISTAIDGIDLSAYATTQLLRDYYDDRQTIVGRIRAATDNIYQGVSMEYVSKETMTGYYTKEEVDSSITVAVDGIDLSVYATKTAVDESFKQLAVGGRNYILYGKGDKKQGFFENFDTVTDEYGEHTLTATGASGRYDNIRLVNGLVLGCRDYEVGKQVTWSYDIMITKWDIPEGTSVREWWMGQRYSVASDSSITEGRYREVTKHHLPKVGVDGCELNKWMHVEHTMTIPEPAAEGIGTNDVIQFWTTAEDISASITFRIKNVKLEYGNKATDWTPAPEEYTTHEEVNSSIKAAVDSIDLTVYKAFTDLKGNVEDAEAKLNMAVLTDENGNLTSTIHIGADLLTIETDNFSLDESGTIRADAGHIGDWSISDGVLSYSGNAVMPSGSTTQQTVELSPAGLYVRNDQVKVEWFFTWANLCNKLEPKI